VTLSETRMGQTRYTEFMTLPSGVKALPLVRVRLAENGNAFTAGGSSGHCSGPFILLLGCELLSSLVGVD
jgi:hypothetical protein